MFFMTEKIVIPFIGYKYYPYEAICELLEMKIPNVSIKRDDITASEGLEQIMKEQYPLIIVKDIIRPGNLKILEKNDVSEPWNPYVTKALIKRIREVPFYEKTPIITTMIDSSGFVEPQEFFDAGANYVIDLWKDNNEPLEKLACKIQENI